MNTEKPKSIYSIADYFCEESSADRICKECSQAKFSRFRLAEEIALINGRYIFLFIIEGQIAIYNKRGLEIIKEKTLIIIDKQQTVKCVCSPETTILEFIPPTRINKFFKSASTIFSMPCSEQVPFNNEVDQWIEHLWNDLYQNIEINEYILCENLCSILRKYPNLVLGTIYVPINACSKRCNICQTISSK